MSQNEKESSSAGNSPPVKGDDAQVEETKGEMEDMAKTDKAGVIELPPRTNDESFHIPELCPIVQQESSTHSLTSARGANLVTLVAEMLRNVDETIRESEARGESLLNASAHLQGERSERESTNRSPSFALEEPSEMQLSVKHAPIQEQYVGLKGVSESAAGSRPSVTSSSLYGIPGVGKVATQSVREALPPEADPFAIREGMTLGWKNVNLTVVRTLFFFQKVDRSFLLSHSSCCPCFVLRKVKAKSAVFYKMFGVRFRKEKQQRLWVRQGT